MYEIDFYNKIKEEIVKQVPEVVFIAPWNNQLIRLPEENSFGLPAVFIEMNPVRIEQYLRGITQIEYSISLHICLEGYLDEDTRMWDFKRRIYRAASGLAIINWSVMENIGARPSFDHDQIQEYVLEFRTLLTDFSDYDGPDRPVKLTPDFTVSY